MMSIDGQCSARPDPLPGACASSDTISIINALHAGPHRLAPASPHEQLEIFMALPLGTVMSCMQMSKGRRGMRPVVFHAVAHISCTMAVSENVVCGLRKRTPALLVLMFANVMLPSLLLPLSPVQSTACSTQRTCFIGVRVNSPQVACCSLQCVTDLSVV